MNGSHCPCTNARRIPVECRKPLRRVPRGGFSCADGHWTGTRGLCHVITGHRETTGEPTPGCHLCDGCGWVLPGVAVERMIDEALAGLDA